MTSEQLLPWALAIGLECVACFGTAAVINKVLMYCHWDLSIYATHGTPYDILTERPVCLNIFAFFYIFLHSTTYFKRWPTDRGKVTIVIFLLFYAFQNSRQAVLHTSLQTVLFVYIPEVCPQSLLPDNIMAVMIDGKLWLVRDQRATCLSARSQQLSPNLTERPS